MLNELELNKWISRELLDRLKKDCLDAESFRNDGLVVIDNFFKKEVIDSISSNVGGSTHLCRKNVNFGPSGDAELDWGPFTQADVLKFIYGVAFRELMKVITKSPLKRAPNYIPQVNRFHYNSKGYYIHNDANETKDWVMLINLNKDYEGHQGGRLQFFKIFADAILPTSCIDPTYNKVVFFKVDKNSWHAIEDMRGHWNRTNIIFDWVIDNGK